MSPTSLTAPGTSTLTWNTENANSASIDHGIGAISPLDHGTVVTGIISSDTTFTLTAHGDTGDVTCHATVTITTSPPPPTAPVCQSFTATPSAFGPGGGTSTLAWTTSNANSVVIDQGVGDVSSLGVASGHKDVTVSNSVTYTATVSGPGGSPVTCSVPVTVSAHPLPVCTLTAAPHSFVTSGAPTLTWTTQNAVSFVINQGVGDVSSLGLASGFVLAPTITTNTTYTGTVTASDGTTATCVDTVTITTSNPPPVCTLTATPNTFVTSGAPTLTWTSANATSITIDQSVVGPFTPVAGGSVVAPTITASTVYTATATGPGGIATCTAPVTITQPGLACTLTASPSSLPRGGGTTTLHWTSLGAVSFSIDQGVGSVTPVIDGTHDATISSDTTFTGTATSASGATVTCQAPVHVDTGGGCTSNCGGGGGGHHTPRVTLEAAPTNPLAFLYLSQIPYTGLDLGPFGTTLYWLALILWSLALAYLLIFKMIPYVKNRGMEFGYSVREAINAEAYAVMHPAAESVAYAPAPAAPENVHAFYSANVEPVVIEHTDPIEPARGYSTYDGFRSFGNGALTIDDIVKGLTREPAQPTRPAPVPVMSHEETPAVVAAPRPEVASMPQPRASQAEAAPVAAEVPHFLEVLLAGNREAAFGMLRDTVRGGGDAESFLTQVACALDDAYRARLEGTPAHAEVKRMTASVATPVLERLVTSFASAVDSSYSVGITGAKLALTRALATLGA